MNEAIKQALDFLLVVDMRFDLEKESHAPGISMRDQFLTVVDALRAQDAGCQCTACRTVLHDSDCAVHNMPAEPNGPCDCEIKDVEEV